MMLKEDDPRGIICGVPIGHYQKKRSNEMEVEGMKSWGQCI